MRHSTLSCCVTVSCIAQVFLGQTQELAQEIDDISAVQPRSPVLGACVGHLEARLAHDSDAKWRRYYVCFRQLPPQHQQSDSIATEDSVGAISLALFDSPVAPDHLNYPGASASVYDGHKCRTSAAVEGQSKQRAHAVLTAPPPKAVATLYLTADTTVEHIGTTLNASPNLKRTLRVREEDRLGLYIHTPLTATNHTALDGKVVTSLTLAVLREPTRRQTVSAGSSSSGFGEQAWGALTKLVSAVSPQLAGVIPHTDPEVIPNLELAPEADSLKDFLSPLGLDQYASALAGQGYSDLFSLRQLSDVALTELASAHMSESNAVSFVRAVQMQRDAPQRDPSKMVGEDTGEAERNVDPLEIAEQRKWSVAIRGIVQRLKLQRACTILRHCPLRPETTPMPAHLSQEGEGSAEQTVRAWLLHTFQKMFVPPCAVASDVTGVGEECDGATGLMQKQPALKTDRDSLLTRTGDDATDSCDSDGKNNFDIGCAASPLTAILQRLLVAHTRLSRSLRECTPPPRSAIASGNGENQLPTYERWRVRHFDERRSEFLTLLLRLREVSRGGRDCAEVSAEFAALLLDERGRVGRQAWWWMDWMCGDCPVAWSGNAISTSQLPSPGTVRVGWSKTGSLFVSLMIEYSNLRLAVVIDCTSPLPSCWFTE